MICAYADHIIQKICFRLYRIDRQSERNLKLNQRTVMCMTRGERRLICIKCQKESVESKLDEQTDLHSDYTVHLWVVQNFDIKK